MSSRADMHMMSDVTVGLVCGYNTIFMLWVNTAYGIELSGEDSSRYSNKVD